MAMPKSVMKINKDGVKFESKVDQAAYTIEELSRRALYDTAKFIRKQMIAELKKMPGMRRNRRIYRSAQFWVRRRETDLQIGFKHGSWYGALQELGGVGNWAVKKGGGIVASGSYSVPARNILRNAVYPNIAQIREIQAQYLSALSGDGASGMVDESEYKSNENGED